MEAKQGDAVILHYTGWLADGTEFDSSRGRDPLEFHVGRKQVIDGVDSAVLGMRVGETKRVEVPAAAAYGEYRDDLVGDVPRSEFPEGLQVEAGQRLQVTHGEDQAGVITILEVTEQKVKVDMNHPLAGQDLVFELELVGIAPTSA
ncbi:MAG: peptidylprolyl isomerase [Planctomycetes bacterium]|nr:peptidylprolyl isomerase [Planctomycetota bacterium]